MGVVVTIRQDEDGNLFVRPASESMAKSYAEDVRLNGGPRLKSPYEAFLARGEAAGTFKARHVHSKNLGDLEQGWKVREDMNAWEIRGLYGYEED